MRLFCFLVLMTAVLYSVKGYPPPEKAEDHYCRRLLKTLSILCMAGYNDVDTDGKLQSGFLREDSTGTALLDELDNQLAAQYRDHQDYKGTRETLGSFECCERHCPLKELLEYC